MMLESDRSSGDTKLPGHRGLLASRQSFPIVTRKYYIINESPCQRIFSNFLPLVAAYFVTDPAGHSLSAGLNDAEEQYPMHSPLLMKNKGQPVIWLPFCYDYIVCLLLLLTKVKTSYNLTYRQYRLRINRKLINTHTQEGFCKGKV